MFQGTFQTLKKHASKITTELVKAADDARKGPDQEELGPPSQEDREVVRGLVAAGGDGGVLSDGPMVVRYDVINGDEADRDGAAFPLPLGAVTGITVGHVKKHFPMPGRYHFRFKVPTPDDAFAGYVWIDMGNDTDFVPVFRNEICIKALRFPSDADPAKHLETLPGGGSLGSQLMQVGRSAPPLAHRASPAAGLESLGSLDGPQDSSPRTRLGGGGSYESPERRRAQSAGDALTATASPRAAAQEAPFCPTKSVPLPADLMDLGGGAAPKAANVPSTPSAPPPPPKVFDREKLVAEREAAERAQIEEGVRRQQEVQQKEADLKAAKVESNFKIGQAMDAWAKTPDGQSFKDVKVLLSTMHSVTWPDSGWKELGLADLLSDGAMKKHYRKAILLVHPDKQTSADPEQQVRADRIFQALNEAFKVAEL